MEVGVKVMPLEAPFGVRQLAAALGRSERRDESFACQGASKLAHSKGFARMRDSILCG